jgi:hypothetical protein
VQHTAVRVRDTPKVGGGVQKNRARTGTKVVCRVAAKVADWVIKKRGSQLGSCQAAKKAHNLQACRLGAVVVCMWYAVDASSKTTYLYRHVSYQGISPLG